MMKFVLPNCDYKEKAKEYVQEFQEYHSHLHGCDELDQYLEKASYEEWAEKVISDSDMYSIVPGKVPSFTYFYVRENDDRIIGMVNIRLALQNVLLKEGGHIGYSVRPTERRKHYGTHLLREALEFCYLIGLSEVIVSCTKSNVASSKIILNCGGSLEAEFYSEVFKDVIQRYRIVENKNHVYKGYLKTCTYNNGKSCE